MLEGCFTSLPIDTQFLILEKKCELEINEAIHLYLIQSSLQNSTVFQEKAEEKNQSEKDSSGVISKICNAIRNFINAFINMLRNMSKDDMDEETDMKDYMKTSKEIKVQYDQDVNAIVDNVSREMVKGRKFIQMISKSTGVDDMTIANYCDLGAKIAIENKKTIVDTASNMLIRKRVLDTMNKSKKIIDESEKALNSKNLSKKEKEQGMRILGTMQKMVVGMGKSSKGLFQKFKR